MCFVSSCFYSDSAFASGAVDVIKTVCNSSENAAGLILAPVLHSNVTLKGIIDKRRELEDQILRLFGFYQHISFLFSAVISPGRWKRTRAASLSTMRGMRETGVAAANTAGW